MPHHAERDGYVDVTLRVTLPTVQTPCAIDVISKSNRVLLMGIFLIRSQITQKDGRHGTGYMGFSTPEIPSRCCPE